jgi:hypothetical protein
LGSRTNYLSPRTSWSEVIASGVGTEKGRGKNPAQDCWQQRWPGIVNLTRRLYTFANKKGEWRRSSRHFWSPFVSFAGERARRARFRPVLMLAIALTHPSRLGAHAIRRVRGEWDASDRLPTRPVNAPADQQGPKRRPTTTRRQWHAYFPRARSERPDRGSESRARRVARACSYPCGLLRGSWVLA